VRQWPNGKQTGPENRVTYVIRSAQHFGVRQWPNGWQTDPENGVEYRYKAHNVWEEAEANWQANWS